MWVRAMARVKKSICCLIFLILTFICCLCFSNNKEMSRTDYEPSSDLVLNISINGQLCSYDRNEDVYYYSAKDLNYQKWKVKVHSLYKVDYFLKNGEDNHFILDVYDNNYRQEVDIIVTSLPIIDLKKLDFNSILSDDIFLDNSIGYIDDQEDYESYFASFIDGNKRDYYTNVDLKLRGSSSFYFPKKAYKISFDEKKSVFGLPKDDKYVLDALYIDKSRVRNILSTDMWQLINDNQKIDNDLHGEFVELFIDNEYMGLYVLKDKVDKSVTQISDSGVLLKSISHMNDYYIDELLSHNYYIDGDIFLNFEIKKYNRDSFYSLAYKLDDYYSCYSYDCIKSDFEIDNFINYMIFVSLISGSDNLTYNRYLSLHDKDSKILITPWDMDLTWGLNWQEDDDLHSVFSPESYSNVLWMNRNITFNMDDKTLSLLKQRYWKLRESVITMDVIDEYLDSYKDVLVNSGAANRDGERWYEYDIEFEIERIREWASNRIQFLDEYFK